MKFTSYLPTHPPSTYNQNIGGDISKWLTLWSVVRHDGDSLTSILKGRRRLFMCGAAEVHTIHLTGMIEISHCGGCFRYLNNWGGLSIIDMIICPCVRLRMCTCSYRDKAVSFPQLPTQVCRASCQDEGDEDALSIFPAHDVEAQPRGSSVEHHLSRFSGGRGRKELDSLSREQVPFHPALSLKGSHFNEQN